MWYFIETIGKKLFNLLLTLGLVVMVVVLCGALKQRADGIHHPKFFDHACAIIMGGSMEPTISNGTVAIIKEQDKYEVDDIITFTDRNDRSITHRIIEIDEDKIRTKGDANNYADPSITQDQIAGKVIFMFPATYLIIFSCVLQCVMVFAIFWPDD